ncbi:MAG: HAD-IB family hydrolase [Nitrospirae bacterium]|nr:MAG: HAD-IB family hydrolase [Nitrospirota bacterium]
MAPAAATLVLVDLDGTLLPPPSAERRFLRHLLSRGWIGPRQLAAAARHLLLHLPEGPAAWRANKAYLAGLPVAAVAREAARFAEAALLPRLRPEVADRLAAHRAAGHHLCLLTGAPAFLADPVARHLGIGRVVASRCAEAGGRFLAAAPRQHPYGEAKRALAEGLAAELGTRLAAAWAYADAAADLPLLEAVGHPVAVHPAARLARAAARRGWERLAA